MCDGRVVVRSAGRQWPEEWSEAAVKYKVSESRANAGHSDPEAMDLDFASQATGQATEGEDEDEEDEINQAAQGGYNESDWIDNYGRKEPLG